MIQRSKRAWEEGLKRLRDREKGKEKQNKRDIEVEKERGIERWKAKKGKEKKKET